MVSKEVRHKFLKELRKSGNVFYSCQKSGMDRSTYYRWMQKNAKFKKEATEAIRTAREDNCDIAEYALMKKISEGEIRAIKYYLDNNSPIYKQARETKKANEKQYERTLDDLLYESAYRRKIERGSEAERQKLLGFKRPPIT